VPHLPAGSTSQTRSWNEEMGFHQGWGAALDPLVALAKTF
jgi:hypothetical protein